MRLAPRLMPLVLAPLVAGLVAAQPVAAAPDRPSRAAIHDTRHDVWKFDVRQDTDPNHLHPTRSPGRRTGDVRVVRIRHTADTIRVRARLARVGGLGYTGVTPFIDFRTRATKVTAMVSTHPQRPPTIDIYTTYGIEEISCPDAVAGVRRHRGLVQVTIPRSCLGDPGWVRTRVYTLDLAVFNAQRFTYYVDVSPGRRTKIKGALSTRAWAPTGAVVADSAPPTAGRARLGALAAPLGALRRAR